MWSRKKLGQYLSRKLHIAPDFLGWDGSTLLYPVQDLNVKAYVGLVGALQLILEGAVNHEPLIAELRRSRGHLLNKKELGQLRAIGVVSWWMQVPAALQIRESKAVIVARVGTENVAVGVPGGSEALARTVQLYLAEHPDHVALATDCTAAFPSIFRKALLAAGKSLSELEGNVNLHYGGSNTLSFVDAAGGVQNVNIVEGGNTGCAKLPFLFTVAVQTALVDLRKRHPGVRVVGQMDDHTFLGEPMAVLMAYLDMQAVFLVQLGLLFNDSKAGMLLGADLQGRLSAEVQTKLEELRIPVVPGIKTGGIPIGSAAFIQQYLTKRLSQVDSVATILEAAAKDNSADTPWQGLFALVQLCIANSQNHLMRALPPSTTRAFAAQFDERVAKLALRTCGHWQAADNISSLQGRVIGLPSCWGGLSIRAIASTADAAYVGAAALIGPAVKGLVAETDFSADSIYRTELQEALGRLQAAITLPNPRPQTSDDFDEESDDEDEPAATQATTQGQGQAAPQPKITTKYLRSITQTTSTTGQSRGSSGPWQPSPPQWKLSRSTKSSWGWGTWLERPGSSIAGSVGPLRGCMRHAKTTSRSSRTLTSALPSGDWSASTASRTFPRRPRARSAKSPWDQTSSRTPSLAGPAVQATTTADTRPSSRYCCTSSASLEPQWSPHRESKRGQEQSQQTQLTRAACWTSAPAGSTTELTWQSTSASQTVAPGPPLRTTRRRPRQ